MANIRLSSLSIQHYILETKVEMLASVPKQIGLRSSTVGQFRRSRRRYP